MATIGLDSIYYALITSDDETETVYETPKKFAPAMSLTRTPAYNRAYLRADDGVVATAGAKGPTALSVAISKLTKEAKADILGRTTNTDGVSVGNKKDRPSDVALMARSEKANGSYKYIVIYKAQFNPPEEAMETKQDTPAFSTPTLTGEAIPRLSDGNDDADVDSDDADIDQTVIDSWFTSIYEKTPVV